MKRARLATMISAAVLMVASEIVVAQNDSSYRVLNPRSGGMQKALDGLTASGERILLADAGMGLLIAQKAEDLAPTFTSKTSSGSSRARKYRPALR